MIMARQGSVFALLLALATAGLASAQECIVDVASVIDGDGVECHNQRIRLYALEFFAITEGLGGHSETY